MDIDTIEPGEDFVEVIENAVGSCEIVVAVMGPRWLSSSDGELRRLDNPNDFVRLEIATTLKRNIRLIPVLVQKATMPRPQDLPEDIAALSRRNAIEISDSRWQYDVAKLIRVLEKVLAARREASAEAARQADEERQRQEAEERRSAEEQRRLAAEDERLFEEARKRAARQREAEAEEQRQKEERRRKAAEIGRAEERPKPMRAMEQIRRTQQGTQRGPEEPRQGAEDVKQQALEEKRLEDTEQAQSAPEEKQRAAESVLELSEELPVRQPRSGGEDRRLMLAVNVASFAVVAVAGYALGRGLWNTGLYVFRAVFFLAILATMVVAWKAIVPAAAQRARVLVIVACLTILAVYFNIFTRTVLMSYSHELMLICIGGLILAVFSLLRNSTVPPTPMMAAFFAVGCLSLIGFEISWLLFRFEKVGWMGLQLLRAASALALTLSVLGFGWKTRAAISARVTAALAVIACVAFTTLVVWEYLLW